MSDILQNLAELGKVLSLRAEKTRLITIVEKGTLNDDAWSKAPKILAAWGEHAIVHFSPKHPGIIVMIAAGKWPRHFTQEDTDEMIGAGSRVRHVVGEDHPDIPFPVDCDAYETEILPD